MVGAELVVGYLFAWIAGKSRRAARRADEQLDQAVDAAVDRLGGRLHELVAGKLAADAALQRLTEEADQGAVEPSARTRTRVALAVEDAAENDPAFGAALQELLRQLQTAQRGAGASAGDGGVAVAGNVDVRADGGSFAAGVVRGDVHFTNPPAPGMGKG